MDTIIINGGDPLPGCPESWDEAQAIEERFNENKDEYVEPRWRFDCGFKLDFDGPFVRVSSRFYPPKSHYGDKWDGTVSLYMFEDGEDLKISEKKFETDTIDQLREQVEAHAKEIHAKIKMALLEAFK